MTGILDARPKVGYFYSGISGASLVGNKIKDKKVKDIMSMPVVIKQDTNIYDSIVTMFLSDVGSVFIIDENENLCGIVSRKDLLKVTIGSADINKMPVGMIMTRTPNVITTNKEDDVVLACSNSGETGEIISILPSLRRIGAKLICVVGKPESTLAKNSDIVLLAEVEREACPLGLAPTTSTTVALALGDALAVCLLERHHFTPENFAVFHPGGSLGRKLLLTVENIMHGGEDNPTVFKGATVRDALFVMTEKGLGATNVIDEEGHLLGLVTDGDVRRGLDSGSNFLEWPVEDMMTSMPRTITTDKLADEALHLME